MAESMVVQQVSDQDFEKSILQAGKPAFVDFWAPWCGPCRAVEPALEQLAEASQGVDFVKLDIDENPGVAGKYGIRSIPTLMLFKDGKHVATKTGAGPKSELTRWITAGV